MSERILDLQKRHARKRNPKSSDPVPTPAKLEKLFKADSAYSWGCAFGVFAKAKPQQAEELLFKTLDRVPADKLEGWLPYEYQSPRYHDLLVNIASQPLSSAYEKALSVLSDWNDPSLIEMFSQILATPLDPANSEPHRSAASALGKLDPRPEHLQTILNGYEETGNVGYLKLIRKFSKNANLHDRLRQIAIKLYPRVLGARNTSDPLCLTEFLSAKEIPLLKSIQKQFDSSEALERLLQVGDFDIDALIKLAASRSEYVAQVAPFIAERCRNTNNAKAVKFLTSNSCSAALITKVTGKPSPMDFKFSVNEITLAPLFKHLDPNRDVRDEFWNDAVQIGLIKPQYHQQFLESLPANPHPVQVIEAVKSIHDSDNLVAPNAVSGTWDTSSIPPPHDELIINLGRISNGLFTPQYVTQGNVKNGRNADPASSTVEFVYNNKYHAFLPEYWGHQLDSHSCVLFANQALENAGHAHRFYILKPGYWILFAHPDQYKPFAAKWGFFDWNRDALKRDYPYNIVNSPDAFEWAYAPRR